MSGRPPGRRGDTAPRSANAPDEAHGLARSRGFAPVFDRHARVLVLGSFPSQASLQAGNYYAHPRNQFWPLMSAVLGADLGVLDWEARYQRLKDHRVALWDVLESCERPGSLDADIREPSGNDLSSLLAELPDLRRVVFNGSTAARHARRLRDAGFDVRVLPSSSPAHAAMRFEDKLERWRQALTPEVLSPMKPSDSSAAGQSSKRRKRHRSVDVPVTLSEAEGVRYLHFGSPWVQGAMLLSHPQVLVLDYVQRMMAWLLFLPSPPEILQLGLGAGSLTRFALARLVPSRVTVVDCSQDVINVAHACFGLPPDGERLTVRCDDAGHFIADRKLRGRFGVVQVDLYDEAARGPVLDSEAFYRDCRQVTAEPGICVVNLFGEHRSFAPNIARLSAAFDGRLLVLPTNSAGNKIVLAFAGPPIQIEWEALRARAATLQQRYGWPVVQWYEAIRATQTGAVYAV